MEKLTELLVGAAEQLGIAVDRVWPQIVMMTFTRAVIDLIIEIIVLIIAAAAIKYTIAWKSDLEKGDRVLETFFKGAALACIGAIFLWTLISIPNTISTILYPEAAAVLKLVQARH